MHWTLQTSCVLPSEVKKKEDCNDRFLETAGQNLFLLGGNIDKSDVFHIPKK